MSKRVQDLIEMGVITDGGQPPIVVSKQIANSIDRWARGKKIPSPTKNMIVFKGFENSDG